jgi:hypothetical protein
MIFTQKPWSHHTHITAGLEWLKHAQDQTYDGGVSAWYSLVTGWRPSYIETTGYIISTFLDAYEYTGENEFLKRAITMGDFLLAMQHPLGGFRTHVPEQQLESEPTVFNTGQDLIGLTDLVMFGAKHPNVLSAKKRQLYLTSALKAAEFLCEIQEPDGSWYHYTYGNTTHAYHTRVAWGLLKVWEVSRVGRYKKAAVKNLGWAAKLQTTSGWFDNAHLPPPNPHVPYTHTIAYSIEGFLWSGLLLKRQDWIEIAMRAARPLAEYFLKHNFLPGTFADNWVSNDRYSCLTGDAQLALVWSSLYQQTNEQLFRRAASEMIEYLKTQQNIDGSSDDIRGALAGSSPLYGDIFRNQGYCRLAYPNWAVKFFVDALLLEEMLE